MLQNENVGTFNPGHQRRNSLQERCRTDSVEQRTRNLSLPIIPLSSGHEQNKPRSLLIVRTSEDQLASNDFFPLKSIGNIPKKKEERRRRSIDAKKARLEIEKADNDRLMKMMQVAAQNPMTCLFAWSWPLSSILNILIIIKKYI